MRSLAIVSTLCAVACASSMPPPASAGGAPASVSAPAITPESWSSQLDRENALVGRVWDVKSRAFVAWQELVSRLVRARFVLLGERHDNPDHHRLQARVVEALIKAGRRPAVVFEMLELEQQSVIDRYRTRPGGNAAGFGAAVGWEKTSWPPFEQYLPIFEAAWAGQLPIAAGNVAQADVKALVKRGTAALTAEQVSTLHLDEAFPAPLEASLIEELRASHCGQLPENLLEPMALAQHARDAQLANVLARFSAKDGAVLIAGGGHARLDRGVPYFLAREAPGASVVSLVFREVRHADAAPEDYVGDEGPFDYVWFTPRGNDDDPCAAFQRKAN